MLLILELFGQLILLGGVTVAAAALVLGAALARPAFPSSSDFLHSSQEMHVV